ncbi:MAG: histidinol-phosphate transaminase [Cyanobacteria bacterium]|nr:histidinol-phosphate transaminase [Cyanobacteriota bacterium]
MPAPPPARPEVESLQAYSAPLEGRRGLLRLDFNENTVGPSPKVVEAIRAIPADHYAIYPEYDGLREAVLASLAAMPGAIVAAAPSTAPVPAVAPGVAPAIRADGVPALATVPLPQQPARRPSLRIEQVGLFNGVDAAIHALFQAYGAPGDRLLTTSPTFGYYTPCARMQGMVIEAIPYRMPGFAFPFEEILAALTTPPAEADGSWRPPRLLLLCNPNNPTGTRLAPEAVLALAAAAPHTLVVVDELYEAFTGDSVLPLLLAPGGKQDPEGQKPGDAASRAAGTAAVPETAALPTAAGADPFAAYPNLLVLRSLSKTAGIAGLRIGFAIGAAAVVDRVSRVTGPYDINSFAVSAAFAALADQPYVDAYVAEVLAARQWLVERLVAAGVRHHVDGGNYLLIWPQRPAAEVDQALREAGILVRSMAGKPLIDGSLRVSLGTREQMERFWGAYASCGTRPV